MKIRWSLAETWAAGVLLGSWIFISPWYLTGIPAVFGIALLRGLRKEKDRSP